MLAAKKQAGQAAQTLPQRQQSQELTVVKKVRSKQQKRKSGRVIVASITAVALALAFALVAVEAKLGSIGYTINETKSQISELQVQCEKLDLEVAQLRSLDRIESYALSNLGMVYLNSEDILYLDYNSQALDTGSNSKVPTTEGAVQSAVTAADVTPAAADTTEQKEQSLLGKLGDVLSSIFSKPASAADV